MVRRRHHERRQAGKGELMSVKDTVVYQGPDGKVTKQDGGYFVQYHAVRQTAKGPKGRYYNTERGARAWLAKQAKH